MITPAPPPAITLDAVGLVRNGAGPSLRGMRRRVAARALEGVSLAVPAGGLLALVGSAASGKSALLRLLAGLDRPSEGTVTPEPGACTTGAMLADAALAPQLSLAENVAAPLPLAIRLRRRAGRAGQVETALELFGLAPLARHLPQAVDAATRQRALLARAIVAEPALLLLDEPFAHQDAAGAAALAATLRHVHRLLGATTVLAARDAAAVLPIADTLALLHEGRLVEAGAPATLYDRPGSALAAGMLGPVNRLPGRLLDVDEDGFARVRLACGPVVEAEAVGLSLPGSPCLFCLRPERIAIAPLSAEEMGGDALDATLVDVRFGGAITRLHLLVGTGAEMVVDRPTAAGLRGLAPGARAALAWQPAHARAYGL